MQTNEELINTADQTIAEYLQAKNTKKQYRSTLIAAQKFILDRYGEELNSEVVSTATPFI